MNGSGTSTRAITTNYFEKESYPSKTAIITENYKSRRTNLKLVNSLGSSQSRGGGSRVRKTAVAKCSKKFRILIKGSRMFQYFHINHIVFLVSLPKVRGGFRGGEAGAPPPLSDSTPCRPKGSPHPVSSVNNRLYQDFSTSFTKIEKQSILIN